MCSTIEFGPITSKDEALCLAASLVFAPLRLTFLQIAAYDAAIIKQGRQTPAKARNG